VPILAVIPLVMRLEKIEAASDRVGTDDTDPHELLSPT
jgi:hypothetical protein